MTEKTKHRDMTHQELAAEARFYFSLAIPALTELSRRGFKPGLNFLMHRTMVRGIPEIDYLDYSLTFEKTEKI